MSFVDEFGTIRAENDNRSAQVIQIEQGKSVAVVALVLAGAALVGLFLQAMMVSSLIDSKAKESSAVAVVRASQASQDAALAKHDVQTLSVELKKHGINVPLN